MLHTGQETQQIVAHEIGVWYESAKGVTFRLCEPAKRVYKSDLHTATVELLNGDITPFAWRPSTTRRRPSWAHRTLRAIVQRVWPKLWWGGSFHPPQIASQSEPSSDASSDEGKTS
jgi:hypothetical protein